MIKRPGVKARKWLLLVPKAHHRLVLKELKEKEGQNARGLHLCEPALDSKTYIECTWSKATSYTAVYDWFNRNLMATAEWKLQCAEVCDDDDAAPATEDSHVEQRSSSEQQQHHHMDQGSSSAASAGAGSASSAEPLVAASAMSHVAPASAGAGSSGVATSTAPGWLALLYLSQRSGSSLSKPQARFEQRYVFQGSPTRYDQCSEIQLAKLLWDDSVVMVRSFTSVENAAPLKEIIITDGCPHPNIAQIFDVAAASNITRLVYCWSPTTVLLRHMMKGEKWSASQKEAILQKALGGITFLHQQKIVHQNLSPDAIFVTYSAGFAPVQVQIADFCGSIAVGHMRLRPTGDIEFRAPEVLLGISETPPQSDVWSMATIFVHLVLGYPMWKDSLDNASQMTQVVHLLGPISSIDCAGLLGLPGWKPEFAAEMKPTDWMGLVSINAGELAADLLTGMFAFSPARTSSILSVGVDVDHIVIVSSHRHVCLFTSLAWQSFVSWG